MLLLIIIGIVVLAVGKAKISKSLVLVGKRARWYGLTLIISAIPFGLFFGGLIRAVTPEAVLTHWVWSRVINYGLLIGYLVLLALPFREGEKPENSKPPETAG